MSNEPNETGDLPEVKLGMAGRLTRAFIASPLTPLMILAALAVGLVALMSLPREEEPQIVGADGRYSTSRRRGCAPKTR